MKLEQQVCSLELAKKLSTLGVNQVSLYFWTDQPNVGAVFFHEGPGKNKDDVSAFAVAELGEIMSNVAIESGNWRPASQNTGLWRCTARTGNFGKSPKTIAETEADARAKMLIYLIENGLYDPKG